MNVFRSDSGDLHREGLPCIEANDGTKIFCWMGKIHNSRGPAVVSPNGTAHYYWRGIHINAQLWEDMPKMTAVEILNMNNAEIRRVAIERLGLERLVHEAKAVDREEVDGGENVLHVIKVNGDEDVVFLELTNSSPEPDGSRKKYFIRVPPSIKGVREGIAWTFELEEKTYNFLVET